MDGKGGESNGLGGSDGGEKEDEGDHDWEENGGRRHIDRESGFEFVVVVVSLEEEDGR